MEIALIFHIHKYVYIYIDHTRFMLFCWERYPFLNNEQIHASDVVLMNAAYGS